MHTIKPKDSFEDITAQLYNINKVIQALYYKPGPRGLEYIARCIQASAEASESGYRLLHRERDRPSQRRGKIKATIERRRPPTLDPPILLLVVSRLLVVVVVLAGRVVVVVVDEGNWLRGSVVWWHRNGYGGKRK